MTPAEATSARIEQVLAELQGMAGPSTWPQVEELVRLLLALHRDGIERLLTLLAPDAGQRERLCADELLSNLLLLHGLHPAPLRQRVERALDEVRPYLASHAGGVELLGVEEGVVRLRLHGTCNGCPSSQATIEQTLRRSIEEAAPDAVALRVEGTSTPDLVPLGLPVGAGA